MQETMVKRMFMIVPESEEERTRYAMKVIVDWLDENVPAFIVEPKIAIKYIDQHLKQDIIKWYRETGAKVSVNEVRFMNKIFTIATQTFIAKKFSRRWSVRDYYYNLRENI